MRAGVDRQPFLRELPDKTDKLPSEANLEAVRKCVEMKGASGFDLVEHIRGKREFENPHVLRNIVEMFDIDCFGTNFK